MSEAKDKIYNIAEEKPINWESAWSEYNEWRSEDRKFEKPWISRLVWFVSVISFFLVSPGNKWVTFIVAMIAFGRVAYFSGYDSGHQEGYGRGFEYGHIEGIARELIGRFVKKQDAE